VLGCATRGISKINTTLAQSYTLVFFVAASSNATNWSVLGRICDLLHWRQLICLKLAYNRVITAAGLYGRVAALAMSEPLIVGFVLV
jgi:hypothetical protein